MTRRSPSPPVAVVSGGPSEERAVSLVSGEAVARALEGEGFPVRRLVIDDSIGPFLEEMKANNEVAFVALHGRYGEDGTVQDALEAAGVPYTGSGPAASRTAMHKPTSKRIFEASGIRTPKYLLAEDDSEAALEAALREKGLRPPLVVKPAASGSSIGVTIVRQAAALPGALAEARRYGDEVLVESFVEGREIAVGVIEAQALPVVELLPAREFYDYEAKYADEATRLVCPAPLPAEESSRAREAGTEAFRALGARDFGRVDLILGKDGLPTVLEVNTIPGFTSHSLLPRAAAAAGVSFGELVGRIVRLAACRGR